jgi:hypothetical protein
MFQDERQNDRQRTNQDCAPNKTFAGGQFVRRLFDVGMGIF